MTVTTRKPMPIAIVGMSCRFAGDATDPEKLWRMVAEGRSAWSEIPSSRFNLEGVYNPNSEKLDTTHVRGGHFLSEDLALFDAAFFNFSAETASTMDPQFRLQLESVYEALENAGITLPEIAGTNTSVYAGNFFHDYSDGMAKDTDRVPRFQLTGVGSAMASNRISHFFDLRGPSMTINTGCSTTLTALHEACQSLKTGDADISIVGGSNLILNPDTFKSMSSLGLLSPEGKSYAFDSRASGYGRGEGIATIILKPLDAAIKAGDPIRAVIRQTLLNQDGKTETITTPSQAAQEELIRACYAKAGISPRETQFFEAHGTGTTTGDPIEANAIASVFGPGRTEPLRIGSVKTNVGHLETTSGLASIIKVALAMEKGLIPPNTNFEKPNPKLSLDAMKLKVPTTLEEWPLDGGVRRASVNNFGYGGSNSHVIIEGYNLTPGENTSNGYTPKTNGLTNGHANDYTNGHMSGQVDGKAAGNPSRVFILSGKDENTTRAMASRLKEHLNTVKPTDEAKYLDHLAYTLGHRRTLFPWVAAASAHSIASLVDGLESPRFQPNRTQDQPRIGMVFTGQGAQWYGMGRELLKAYPAYRQSIEEAENYLHEFGAKYSLLEELLKGPESSRVSDVSLSTPLCVAVQISLVRLLRSWGIIPTAVTSHSSGEVAAAYTAGALDYRSAMAVSYLRSSVTGDPNLEAVDRRPGGMMAVGLGSDATEEYMRKILGAETPRRLVVACINSPSSVTVSGDLDALEKLEGALKDDGIFARKLLVKTAYHSHHMVPLAKPYQKFLRQMNVCQPEDKEDDMRSGKMMYTSPTTGGIITDANVITRPEHWVESLLQPVQFVDALHSMIRGDETESAPAVDLIIEVGPHAALRGPIYETLNVPEFKSYGISYLSCLVRKESAVDTMQDLASNLLRKGFPLDMGAVNFPFGRTGVKVLHDLPPYPWDHRIRHWTEARVNRAYKERKIAPHDLLGSLIPGMNPQEPTWRNMVRSSEIPWIRDHVVQSDVVYPGAGYICLAIDAIYQLHQIAGTSTSASGYSLRDIEILQALVIPSTGSSEGVEIQTSLRPTDAKAIGKLGWWEFQIFSVTNDNAQWTLHAKGLISLQQVEDTKEVAHSKSTYHSCVQQVDPQDLYAGLRSVEINHGPNFQNVKKIRAGENRSVSSFVVADIRQQAHVLHPTTLDSIFQAAYSTLSTQQAKPRVPRSIKEMWVAADIRTDPGHCFEAYSELVRADLASFRAGVVLVDASKGDGANANAVLRIDGLTYQSVGSGMPSHTGASTQQDICAKLRWAPDLALLQPDVLKKRLNYPTDQAEINMLIDLRRACIYYISDALKSLTAKDLEHLTDDHRKYYAWMQLQLKLAREGSLGSGSERWLQDTEEDRTKLLRKVEASSVNGEMVCHLGRHIASVLRAEQHGLELMMENKLLYKYYAQALKWDRSMTQMAELMRHFVHKNPRAKILEIGAGTGAATRHALQVIGTSESGGPQAAKYHFTDISPGFFAEAKNEFADWEDIISFHKLDIEADPATQGFECGTYDLIIACQVLHATHSMDTTLKHVRKLLKPSGRLLMTETTQDELDMQLTFGLLPGWWLSEEPERKYSPNLTLSLWDKFLRRTGFNAVEFEVHDCDDESFYAKSTIMTTVAADTNTTKQSDVVLVVGDNSPPATWTEALRSRITKTLGNVGLTIQTLDTSVDTKGKICVFLGEIDRPVLRDCDEAEFDAVREIAAGCKGLLWVSRSGAIESQNPELSLGAGFIRSLRHEYPNRTYASLDLDTSTSVWTTENLAAIGDILKACFNSSTDPHDVPADLEYAIHDGLVLVPRVTRDVQRNKSLSLGPREEAPCIEAFHQEGHSFRMIVDHPGQLDSLIFVDDPTEGENLLPGYIEVEPKAYGLNFIDIVVAAGQDIGDASMGVECSGVVTRIGSGTTDLAPGDAVLCVLKGHYANRVRLPATSAVRMPANMSFETAASIPAVYLTAYISLIEIAKLRKGQSVLIHAAAGGVGQAAVVLAKHIGAEIFATVGTSEKRNFMVEKYGIKPDHILSSRDRSFAPELRRLTEGRGVDVVLNSLAGALLQESFNCLAPFGHFVEIGKRDFYQNSALEMGQFSKSASFSSFDLMGFSQLRGPEHHKYLREIVRMWEDGSIEAIPITTYSLTEIQKAFRTMQTGKHMGKIVITIGPNETVPVRHQPASVYLNGDASYLIVGGAGGIGQSLARWMVRRGARNLILLSRSAGSNENKATQELVFELQGAGCRTKAISCDVSSESSLGQAFTSCWQEGFPPIRGVVQAAMVLDDSLLEQMTLGNWMTAIRPKVHGSWNLHRQLSGCDLDFFLMLSSLVGVIGMYGQSNYSAGGSYQDALARHRVAQGLPGVSIDLGAVKSVGYVAENAGVLERMTKLGFLPLSESQVLAIVESAILSPFSPNLIVRPDVDAASSKSPIVRDSRFSNLRSHVGSAKSGGSGAAGSNKSGQRLAGRLAAAASPQEAEILIVDELSRKIASIFMLPREEIMPNKRPSDYGVDSLVAIEMREMITLETGADVSIFQIMQSPSLTELAKAVAAKCTTTAD